MQPANALLPRGEFVPERLLAPHQALVAYFARVPIPPPAVERVALDEACGRVLAQNVEADDDYPNAARSLMDGFAVRAQDTPGVLDVSAPVAMGRAPQDCLRAGRAARIPTGGVMPDGADAVVPVEDVRLEGERLLVGARVECGANVAPRASDMQRGEALLAAGTLLGARHAGVLATLGLVEVPVYRKPVVAVLSTGDELIDPSQRPAAGQIRDSNRYAIAASLRAMGAEARHFPTLPDEPEAFAAGLAAALASCDAVVVSGGSSVGERDRLPDAVAALGAPGVVVHGLRVKPGKPLLLGAIGLKPVLGLPGNPTSALMMLEAVAAPIVGALTGHTPRPAQVAAVLGERASSRPGWTWYVPVALQDEERGTPVAHPLALRSFSVSLAARAGGYIVMGERDDDWPRGSSVTVNRFLGG